jgi:hypothetical protein
MVTAEQERPIGISNWRLKSSCSQQCILINSFITLGECGAAAADAEKRFCFDWIISPLVCGLYLCIIDYIRLRPCIYNDVFALSSLRSIICVRE